MSAWLFRTICAAIVCTLLNTMAGEGPGKGLRKLLSQTFLILTLLSPLREIQIPQIDTDHIRQAAEYAALDGSAQAAAARDAFITDRLEAYILSKADALGLELTVRVELDDTGLPVSVILTGAWSPAERQQLSDAITRDLGLGKEVQTWNTAHQSSE